jgi:hypothetical protein
MAHGLAQAGARVGILVTALYHRAHHGDHDRMRDVVEFPIDAW